MFQFSIELHRQLLQVLLLEGSFHILSELDLLSETQNLHSRERRRDSGVRFRLRGRIIFSF